MVYVITTYDDEKLLGTYTNLADPLPSIKDILTRFRMGKSLKLFSVDEKSGREQLEMTAYRLPYIDYTAINTYADYVEFNCTERTRQFSMILNGESLESVTMYDKNADIVITSLNYKGNNLHGTQLIKHEGCLYTVETNHGRFVNMNRYSGGLFSYGTRLEQIDPDDDVLDTLMTFDRHIRELFKK